MRIHLIMTLKTRSINVIGSMSGLMNLPESLALIVLESEEKMGMGGGFGAYLAWILRRYKPWDSMSLYFSKLESLKPIKMEIWALRLIPFNDTFMATACGQNSKPIWAPKAKLKIFKSFEPNPLLFQIWAFSQ